MTACEHQYVTNVREDRDSDGTVLGWWVDCQECPMRDIYRPNEAWQRYLAAQRTNYSSSSSYRSSAPDKAAAGARYRLGRVTWRTAVAGAVVGVIFGFGLDVDSLLFGYLSPSIFFILAVFLLAAFLLGMGETIDNNPNAWHDDAGGCLISFFRAVLLLLLLFAFRYVLNESLWRFFYADPYRLTWLVSGAVAWTLLALLWPAPWRRRGEPH
jgi:hypothetical protein